MYEDVVRRILWILEEFLSPFWQNFLLNKIHKFFCGAMMFIDLGFYSNPLRVLLPAEPRI